ncbi:MAG: hypothetical protein A2086_14790 [Spirochaetes bacterium GWD1_27_9]|nr:MAG: hypothetical protein A2Z98_04810 [Spirochaetes bacterium GWB1_27_13]OHD45361.1 MAG: hypothetical protein A2086_14790 [Spirochaetes bacterium GWD1_27_9]
MFGMFIKQRLFIKRNLPLIISVFFLLFLSILLINFVNNLFISTQEDIIERERILIVFLVILSVSLLVIIILFFLNIGISVIKKEFGARMRLKITLFFVFVSLLPIFPFVQIGTKFIESSMNIWFSKNLGFALNLSEEIVVTYYSEKKELLVKYVDELNKLIKEKKINSFIDYLEEFIQKNNIKNISLWTEKGEIIEQFGENIFDFEIQPKRIKLEEEVHLLVNKEGIFPLETKTGSIYLIIPSKILNNDKKLIGFLNIGITISPYYLKATNEIENALKIYNTTSLYKDFFTRGFSILFITIIFPIILIVLIISLFLTKELLEPIESLSMATQRVASGDYNFQISSSFNDEFTFLSKSFNSMINDLEVSREKLQQKEKIATWGEIAKQLAHEIKNPLTPIRLSSERILRRFEEGNKDFKEILQKGIKTIITEVENMDRMLSEFENFARLPVLRKEKGDVVRIIEDVVDLFSVNKNDVKLNFLPIKRDYQILRDELQLKSAFVNILKNLIENTENKETIEIFIDDKEVGFKKYLVIVFKNKNESKEINELEDIFVPYFSTKENNKKLETIIAQRIITEHEGRINFLDKKRNSCFIELPIVE